MKASSKSPDVKETHLLNYNTSKQIIVFKNGNKIRKLLHSGCMKWCLGEL